MVVLSLEDPSDEVAVKCARLARGGRIDDAKACNSNVAASVESTVKEHEEERPSLSVFKMEEEVVGQHAGMRLFKVDDTEKSQPIGLVSKK